MSSNPKKRGTVNISLLGTKLAFQLAFLDLLDEKKLKEITIGELSRRAGVSKNTFYNHFADMFSLLKWIVSHALRKNAGFFSCWEILVSHIYTEKNMYLQAAKLYRQRMHSLFFEPLYAAAYQSTALDHGIRCPLEGVELLCRYTSNTIAFSITDWIEDGLESSYTQYYHCTLRSFVNFFSHDMPMLMQPIPVKYLYGALPPGAEKKNPALCHKLRFVLHELAEQKGFSAVTVTEIAAGAGISRPTFYRYFRDKYDLLLWVYEVELFEIIRKNALSKQLQLSHSMYRYLYHNKALFIEVLCDYEQNSLLDYIFRSTWDELIRRADHPCDDFQARAYKCWANGATENLREWARNGMIALPWDGLETFFFDQLREFQERLA